MSCAYGWAELYPDEETKRAGRENIPAGSFFVPAALAGSAVSPALAAGAAISALPAAAVFYGEGRAQRPLLWFL